MFVALRVCVCIGPSDRVQHSTRLCLETYRCNEINTLFTRWILQAKTARTGMNWHQERAMKIRDKLQDIYVLASTIFAK